MRITVLTHNLSSNAAMRAHRLAQAASRFADVTLIGPVARAGPWAALPRDVPIVSVKKRRFPDFFPRFVELVERADGDVLIAVKPHLASFGAALVASEKRGAAVILDVDDLEAALAPRSTWSDDPLTTDLSRPGSMVYVSLLSRATGAAAAVTASSTALARRFQGEVVYHGVDADLFDPARIDRERARRAFGFMGPTVLFAGTPRGHKGLKELALAVARIPGAQLAVACRSIDLGGPEWDGLSFHRIPLLPYGDLPQLLVAADAIAIPQLAREAADYQMPMKVFDAMAAARPIVASAVSDLPIVLEGCGRLTPPGDVEALAESISDVLDNSVESREMGQRARERCLSRYTLSETSRLLEKIVGRVAGKLQGPARS
ncbi:MAG TPA: glycosyltransferase [Thermoanaerobaculia bacterium]|nr:glycosyltransferase [Thermoanaerobaculia bacterium]